MPESNKNIPLDNEEYVAWCQVNGVTRDVFQFQTLMNEYNDSYVVLRKVQELFKTAQPTAQGIFEPKTRHDIAARNLYEFLVAQAARKIQEG